MKGTFARVAAVATACLLLVVAVMFVPQIPSPVHAQVGPGGSFILFNSGDPCLNPNVAKAFGVMNISSATTTELVAAVTGKTVYLCSLQGTFTATSPTVLFKTGTKVTNPCDTSPTNQSGTYAITSGAFVKFNADGAGPLLTSALSGELCLTSGGTGPSFQGNYTYVQQ